MSNLIAILGPKGSGKTTLSRYLETQHNYTPTSFATPLKLMLKTLLEYQNLSPTLIYEMLYGDLKETETKYLDYATPRRAMQTLGSEWRDLISRNLWVNIWENKIYSELNRGRKITVDDARFIHEVNVIRNLGGKIVKIHRPGYEPSAKEHISETEQGKIVPDLLITNDSSLENMYLQIDNFLNK
jgi:deoxyadenosine/deoxycytidine kinase